VLVSIFLASNVFGLSLFTNVFKIFHAKIWKKMYQKLLKMQTLVVSPSQKICLQFLLSLSLVPSTVQRCSGDHQIRQGSRCL
jgi:hypothetical protein